MQDSVTQFPPSCSSAASSPGGAGGGCTPHTTLHDFSALGPSTTRGQAHLGLDQGPAFPFLPLVLHQSLHPVFACWLLGARDNQAAGMKEGETFLLWVTFLSLSLLI